VLLQDLQKVKNFDQQWCVLFDQILKLLQIAFFMKENISSLIRQKGTDIIIQKLVDFLSQSHDSEQHAERVDILLTLLERVVTYAAEMNITEVDSRRRERSESLVFDHHESAGHHTTLFIDKIVHSCEQLLDRTGGTYPHQISK
jgi:hypothetical protein